MRNQQNTTVIQTPTIHTLYVASWPTQYEFSTRKLVALRPTRSSATERSERWNLSLRIPWWLGLPYTIPFGFGRLRPPRRTRVRKMTKPCLAL